ncbi:MAG: hypothetical protein PUF13_00270 [Lachnospiraceae bacterium]|nr:hypothetical protein [Lachnospiraceae bacterium]
MINKPEQASLILEEMERYLNSAKYTLFSNTTVMVDRIRMEEYIQELRHCITQDDSV